MKTKQQAALSRSLPACLTNRHKTTTATTMDALDAYGSSGSSSDDEENASSSVERQQPRGVVRRVAVDAPNGAVAATVVRHQPHVNGNWAGHVYIRLGASSLRRFLRLRAETSVNRLADRLERWGYSGDCCLIADSSSHSATFHVSLSRPFYLQAANLEPFARALARQVALIPPFGLTLADHGNDPSQQQQQQQQQQPPHRLLQNDEGTRSFWVWPVAVAPQPAASPLRQLVRRVDACLALYGQPPYHDPPVFHASLASLVPAVPDRIARRLSLLPPSSLSSSTGSTGTGSNANSANAATACEDDDDDDDDRESGDEQSLSSSSSSSSEEEGDGSPTQLVTEIHVKFGTTKEYIIPLHQSR